MFLLYGFRTSSYYSMIKLVLMEKAIPFREIHVPLIDGQLQYDNQYLEISPMAKVPGLETPDGPLSETSVIFDYLDEYSTPHFFPTRPYEKAKVKELIKHMELYLELPARRLYGEFFGTPVAAAVKTEVLDQLQQGFASFQRLIKPGPYLTGNMLTYADFFGFFALTSVTRTTKALYGWDSFNTISGIRTMIETLNQRETMVRLMAERSDPI